MKNEPRETKDPELSEQSVPSRFRKSVVITLLLLHGLLLGWSASRNSWTWDEVSFLPAGISHWKFGNYELFDVNPPLVRMVAAVPVLFADPVLDWSGYTEDVRVRPERPIGENFVSNNGRRSLWLLTMARWACIPFSLLGAFVCYHWSRKLYGDTAGLLALGIWTFAPTIIGHGQLITADVGGASIGILGMYVFWRWLNAPSWRTALILGAVLGIMELTKTTWVILFGLWPVIWVLWRLFCEAGKQSRWFWRDGRQLAAVFCMAVYILNLGYGFEGTGTRLGEYEFISTAVGGPIQDEALAEATKDRPFYVGVVRNRFTGTLLGELPVPLPVNYVRGIDRQKSHFEGKSSSYLAGEWRREGWLYYYLYAALVKVPVGTWIIIVSAVCWFLFERRHRANLRDEVFLFGLLITLLTFVSLQTGINKHMRYIMPSIPLGVILISRVAQSIPLRRIRFAVPTVAGFCWLVYASLSTFPHHIAYFNEPSGGPENGYQHLQSSNTDWGQGLVALSEWVDEHPEASPLGLDWHARVVDTRIVGIEPHPIPELPTPGWFAISANKLTSVKYRRAGFTSMKPVATPGYSIHVFHVTEEDANRIRAEKGYPPYRTESVVRPVEVVDPQFGRQDLRFVVYSEAWQRVVSGSSNGSVVFHDPTRLQTLRTSTTDLVQARAARFSPDGETLAVGYSDGSVRIWRDPEADAEVVQCETGAVNSISFAGSGDKFAVAGDDRKVEVRSTEDPDRVLSSIPHELPVVGVALSLDGKVLASGTGKWQTKELGVARLWNTETGQVIRELPDSTGLIKVLSFSPDGTQIVGRSTGERLRVWNAQTGQCEHSLINSTGVYTIAFAAGGNSVVAGGNNGCIRMWDMQSGKLIAITEAHDDRIYGCCVLGDTGLATACRDGSLKRWDLSGILTDSSGINVDDVTAALRLNDTLNTKEQNHKRGES